MPAPITGGTYTGGTGMPTRLADLAVDNSNSIDSTTGRLIIELAAASNAGLIGAVRLQDGAGTQLSNVNSWITADGIGAGYTGLHTLSESWVWNGSGADKARSASAANLIAQSGLGAALVAPPGMWFATSSPVANTTASASRAAGGAGVRHVVTKAKLSYVSSAVPVAATTDGVVRDGASGVGSLFDTGIFAAQAVAGDRYVQDFGPFSVPGTAATAATAEFAGPLGANTLERASIIGFDAS